VILAAFLGGLFGHKQSADPWYVVWWHAVAAWVGAHWGVLAAVIPLVGTIVAALVSHYLSVSRENRARRLTHADLRTRVHADLAARLLAHCSYVQRAYRTNAIDPSAWRRGNAGLRERAEMTDLIDVMGPRYVSFMAAIERERRILEDLAADEKSAEGAREVLRLYAPFIAEFGEPAQARRLERT